MGGAAVDQNALSASYRREPSPSPSPSLSGSLDSFPLADVLALLASTGNTGALEVTGGGSTGRLFVGDGAVVAAEAGRLRAPVEVVVELLGLEDGEFVFEPDEVADHPGPPVTVPSLLSDVRARLDEWHAIEAVLPSVDHVLVLASRAPGDAVVLSAEQWRAVAAIADGGPLGLLLGRLAADDLDALRLVKGLVELGLLDIVDPPEDGWDDDDDEVDDDDDVDPLPAPAAWRPRPEAVPVVDRAPKPVPRVTDPGLQARLDLLAQQFDAVYDAQAAAIDVAEAPCPRTGLFAKLRHRHEH